jgi:hypothetical protein
MAPRTRVQPRTMTLKETAAYWGLSINTFGKLLQQGTAPGPLKVPGLRRHLFDREQQAARWMPCGGRKRWRDEEQKNSGQP